MGEIESAGTGPGPRDALSLGRAANMGGLRERKRTAAMHRIQTVAMDLFERDGYADVTVEQVAEASDVSPSSVYRYFGTKEQILLWDEFDPILPEVMKVALADAVPLSGVRRAIEVAMAGFTDEDERRVARRLRLIMGNPALESAVNGHTYVLAEAVGELLAERLERPPADLEVQVFAHAFIGGLLGAFHHWHGTGFEAPLREVLERCFVIFEEGLDVVAARS
jgi:AcrR family transcriptional regulator